jgi:NTE family protein
MLGIALEGGGAKGAYQVGAYIALKKKHIKPSIIAGTSIGSVNAALMVQGDIKKLVNLWLTATTDIFGINSELAEKIKSKNLKITDIELGVNNIKKILKNKGIDVSKFLNLLKSSINEDKIRKSKIKLGLITVKVDGLKPLELTIDDIPKGKLAEYILASCYLPLFNYKPIIDNKYYIDGGFYNNIPLSLVENYGCDTIYSIRIKGIGVSHNKLKKETKVIEIKPSENLGSIIIFDKESNIHNMKLGYYDTLKVLDNLDGNKYYFKNKTNKYYEKIIRHIDVDLIIKLKFKYRTLDTKLLVIKIFEDILKKEKLERFKIYNPTYLIFKLKRMKIKDKNLKTFIKDCKLF